MFKLTEHDVQLFTRGVPHTSENLKSSVTNGLDHSKTLEQVQGLSNTS